MSVPRLREPANLVSPRARVFWAARCGAGWLLLIAAQVALIVLLPPAHRGLQIALLVASVLLGAVHATVMPQWRFRVHRWEVTPTACYAQDGWITQRRRIAPLSRVQTVDTERGPLEQLFRLASVTITTASAAGPITIKGLDAAVAGRLVDELTVVTASSSGDAT
ncbi:PH domain-containing protein [Jatrophihabitans telluris]|uniref:PH domain-containing protein n=1 Tax=Jatrophihabitans telluris TaxID=2038343 RepID=A0ABY4QXN2_9ACTN|nr:PH domain-containing protein [Jatrophihabitans telluris]UQX88354.1 PH domain-containing protein [Jatrophihabitans telluris]